ncbi:aminodeoxychorismate lyase [Vibrio sp. SCSIO 43137]|uniref:aminodeoxychorismate lyase n=1 Tax=Vibrio sp. SCSIO 43137 TaxID=3021011 RepID=UPI002307DE9A|nr:aminodeoxychorismate lyase [Vibrio sp. SCSIO 43137]WCE30635.1 aminodeoxychorismate lyase [Vibrio sp. SCSIO 43137]
MFWVNGEPATQVSVSDRSFQYGDGCFTTILTRNGKPEFWQFHKERLQACLDLLEITQPDWQQVLLWLEKAALTEQQAGLKLHISRGACGRGYSPLGICTPQITISHFAYPQHYPDWQSRGVALGICQRRLGHNPMLAGHKHNNRLEQVLIKSEADKLGYQDALVFDIQHKVIETTMANLFWVKDGVLYTPDLSDCGVAGVARRRVLQLAESCGIELKIAQYEAEHVYKADEVFITNSILTVAPVCKIADKAFQIGSLTRDFQRKYSS